MVFFTCQHCGSSLKKNTVEKHYFTECRNRIPNLTCVDCLKDFLGDAYVSHTSCLTEEEKYSAKGFKSKPPCNKGAKKQVSWMNSIQETEAPKSMTPLQMKIIHRCKDSSNVPQKRIKFQNFCKYLCGKFCNINQIDEVFDLFEKVHKNAVDESNAAISVTNVQTSDERTKDNSENSVNSISVEEKSEKEPNSQNFNEDENVNMENGENPGFIKKLSKKEKKELKRKAKLAENVNGDSISMELDVSENCENENIENGMNNSKNKNFDNLPESNMEIDRGNCTEEVGQSEKQLSKKEKKKLKKQEKYNAELNAIAEFTKSDNMEDEETPEENNSRKKKKRKNESNGVIENGIENKKSKKRNRECDMDVEEAQDAKKSKDNSHENGVSQPEENSDKPQFNWNDIIIQVLQSRKDKELPIKRLAKKVINEYQYNYATYETFEKISAKFHKKLKKIPGVKILHDKAKLITSDE